MITDEVIKTIRIAKGAQERQAVINVIDAPVIQQAMKVHADTLRALNLQIQMPELSPALTAQLQVQNRRIAEMLDSSGLRKAIAGIDFKLPEGLAEQMAAYREQLEVEAAKEEADGDGAGLGRLVDEREAIIVCLKRIGAGVEGFAYVPGSPMPHFVGFLILALAMIGEVANEKLTQREAADAE